MSVKCAFFIIFSCVYNKRKFYAWLLLFFGGITDPAVFNEVQRACVSSFAVLNEDKYKYRTETPWHKNGSLGVFEKISFYHDFEKNRLSPLARVFGVPIEQVKDLAGYIYTHRWNQSLGSSSKPDSRAELWKSRRNNYDPFDSRYSFPNIDNKHFYTEYHLLLEVASKLLESMPVLKGYDDGVSAWDEWLEEYLILSDDKALLAELRDPMPLQKPVWTTRTVDENWQWQIQESDFIDIMINRNGAEFWLNVEGSWSYYKDGKCEDVSFSTILVPKELSQSLLHTTCSYFNHLDEVYLQGFCGSVYSDNEQEFSCQEWLVTNDYESELESKDPYSGTIQHRPMTVAKFVSDSMGISYSHNKKQCSLISDNSLCLENKYWSEDKPRDSNSYTSSGRPVRASLNFLKLISHKLNVDVAIQINIKRSYTDSYRNRNNDDELGYLPRYSKTFILSADGRLRDSRKSYQLGKDAT
ncbi:hypothetical protein ATS71_08495 [Pseudoalteromonas sp. H71]|nr:hypothetical protein ATS71_08495 [Pseudoalteromonas sp. H71]